MATKTAWSEALEAAIVGKLKSRWTAAAPVVGGLAVTWGILTWTGYTMAFRLWVALALLLWLLASQADTLRWMHRRRRTLAAASLPAPSARDMLTTRRLEQKRIKTATKQWEVFCDVHRFRGTGKVIPPLRKPRATVAVDLEFNLTLGPIGLSVDKLTALTPQLAEIVGCKDAHVKKVGVGNATLTLLWSDPLNRDLLVADMPMSPADRISYAGNPHGDVVSVIMSLSLLIVGYTGSGKSSILWALLIDLFRKVNHILYVSDPKGGQEFGILEPLVGQTHGHRTVADWVGSAEKTERIIDKMDREMKARQEALKGTRKWSQAMDEEYPLIVGIIDEALEVVYSMKPATRQKLYAILSQGRAAGVMLILLSQLPHKEILGQTRALIAQRIGLATESPLDTSLIFGDTQAEDKGARCSEIVLPGVGFARIEGERGYQQFRGYRVDDDDVARYVEGELPDGMGTQHGKAPVNRQCAVYYFFNTAGQSLYVGVAVDPTRRRNEHAGLGGKPEKWWWPHVDEAKTVIIWADSVEAARVVEEREIRRFQPVGNVQHNSDNPMAGRLPPALPAPPAHHWWSRPKPPQPETPQNVTPLNRSRPTKPVPGANRKRASA